jgi:hypothetical protein
MAKRKINKAVFFLESQPPHLGELIAVLSVVDEYELLYICVSNKGTILPVAHVIKMWEFVLKAYNKKIVICSTQQDFRTTTDFPEMFEGCKILTVSQRMFANFATTGLPVILVASAIGYDTVFEATAFRKARSYHYLKSRSYLKKENGEN